MKKNSVVDRVNFRKSITHSPSVKRRLRVVNDNYEKIEMKQTTTTKSLINAIHEGLVDFVQELLTQQVYRNGINELDGLGLAFLHHAARYDQVKVARILVENGAELNVRSDEGLTPLHISTRFDALATLQFLLSIDADPSVPDNQGNTVLHHSVKRANAAITEILLQHPKVQVDTKNNAQMTSLHLTCNLGNEQISELLINHGADIRAKSGDHVIPIHLAVTASSLNTVKQLIDKAKTQNIAADELMNEPDFEGNTALHLAVQSADQSIVSFCLQNGADVNAATSFQSTPLHIAAGKGSLEVVRLLLGCGAALHATDTDLQTPLHSAAAMGHLDVITFLVQNGATLEATDTNNRTPLLAAVACGKKESAEELIRLGADMKASDILNRNCLHICIEHEQIDVLNMFLGMDKEYCCLHNPDIDDRYAIHYAALANNFKILEALLAADPMTRLQDCNQQTPLHLAAARGLARHVQALVKYAAEVNKSDDQGRTPLHNAAAGGRRKCCVILVQSGADVNVKDNNRWTPLMLAAKYGCSKTCLALIDNHAFISAITTNKETALSIAISAGNPECVTILLDRGADVSILSEEGSKAEIGCPEVAMALVKHERWQEILGIRRNLLVKLIQHFPEAAQVVLGNCIHRSGLHSDPEYTITYDFRFLDAVPGSDQTTTEIPPFIPSVMVEYAREELLLHPLTQKFLDTKWSRSGRYLYYFFFFWYLVFLATYSVFVITERETKEFNPRKNKNQTNIALADVFGVKPKQSNQVFLWMSFVFVVFHMLKEISQMLMQRLGYFTDISNLTEWAMYVTTLFFMIPFIMSSKALAELDDARSARALMNPEALWTSGVVSIFLAYVNLLLFLRRFRMFGLYVSMFVEVTKTLIQVIIAFFVVILAFAISFFVLFKEQPSFRTVGMSLVRTSVMMIGEFDFQATFVTSVNETNHRGAKLNPMPDAALLLLSVFLLLMSIVLMNLLVGLAVGDIETVRRNATLKRLSQMVRFVADVEKKYPRFILRWFYVPRLTEKPYKTKFEGTRYIIMKKASQTMRSLEANLEQADEAKDNGLRVVARHVIKNKKRIKSMMVMMEAQSRLLRHLVRNHGPDEIGEHWYRGDLLTDDDDLRDDEDGRSNDDEASDYKSIGQ